MLDRGCHPSFVRWLSNSRLVGNSNTTRRISMSLGRSSYDTWSVICTKCYVHSKFLKFSLIVEIFFKAKEKI